MGREKKQDPEVEKLLQGRKSFTGIATEAASALCQNDIHIARATVCQKALVLGTARCGCPGINIDIDTDNPEVGIAACLSGQEGNLIEQAVDLILVIGADPAVDPDSLRLVELINPGDLPIMAVHRNRLLKYDITRACLVTIAYSQFWWKASKHLIKKQ